MHPAVGKHREDFHGVRVHGDVSYSGPCGDLDPDFGVCAHVHPQAPRIHAWLVGFDCGHGSDLQPLLLPLIERLAARLGGRAERFQRYRTLPYARQQCHLLATQLG